jgi:hypothetical protein
VAKPGPKPKIGESEKKQILAVVRIGGSLSDAAGAIGVCLRSVQNAMKNDARFCTGVKRARKMGKIRLIRKVGKATAWQAAAWMLERKYGREYGRKETVERTGQPDKQIVEVVFRRMSILDHAARSTN